MNKGLIVNKERSLPDLPESRDLPADRLTDRV